MNSIKEKLEVSVFSNMSVWGDLCLCLCTIYNRQAVVRANKSSVCASFLDSWPKRHLIWRLWAHRQLIDVLVSEMGEGELNVSPFLIIGNSVILRLNILLSNLEKSQRELSYCWQKKCGTSHVWIKLKKELTSSDLHIYLCAIYMTPLSNTTIRNYNP